MANRTATISLPDGREDEIMRIYAEKNGWQEFVTEIIDDEPTRVHNPVTPYQFWVNSVVKRFKADIKDKLISDAIKTAEQETIATIEQMDIK